MAGRLSGQVALVTGASRGIGRAIAQCFAREGAAVALLARPSADLEEAVKTIRKEGGRALATPADVSQEEPVFRAVRQTLDDLGPVDILVNNAGMATPGAPLQEVTLEDWETTFAVNMTGMFLCSKAVLPSMIERRQGLIINIASISGLWRGVPHYIAYACTKWSAVGFTKALDQEVRPHNIRVSAICPGGVDTHFLGSAPGRPENAAKLRPESIAETTLFIATQPSSAVVEQVTITPINQYWGFGS